MSGPLLSVKVNDRFTRDLNRRLKKLIQDVDQAAVMAARAATTSTRANFKYKRDAIAPRPGRSSSGGHMKQSLLWTARQGQVEFNIKKADEEVPHWIIQEIGTGNRATIRRGGEKNPRGRPKKGSNYVRSVESQVGRRIKAGLVFATGGQYSEPGSRRDEQLHLASTVTGVPQWGGKKAGKKGKHPQAASIRIRKEIEPQNFVRKGGQHGFREYKQSVHAAARQAFSKSSRS